MHWHYSRAMPSGKLFKLGVWEHDAFIGSVIFGRGANNNLAKSFNLKQTECVELVRVALNKHESPVSKIMSICLTILKKDNSGLKLVASYADETNQNHLGIIYQAGNWIYLGKRTSKGAAYYIIGNKKVHGRSVRAKWGSEKNIPVKWKYADDQEKHLYAYVLDKSILSYIISIRESYPKRVTKATAVSNSKAAVQSRPTRSKLKKAV